MADPHAIETPVVTEADGMEAPMLCEPATGIEAAHGFAAENGL
jgi:hypothetical protein